MTRVIAVIGSGFGDEGKGLMTDYYSSKYDDAVVIRSNGGAQAGHTVTLPTGERHVFSHFGAGTLDETPTFLSSYFVSNPLLFVKEYTSFVTKFGITPKIYVDRNSLVTTPYDMLLNQRMETMRGIDVHGSCGVGFGETIERELVHSSLLVHDLDVLLDYSDDMFVNELYLKLHRIRKEYIPTRINLNKVSDVFVDVLNNDDLIYEFIKAARFMMDHVEVVDISHFKDNTLVFEGAQGLLLDMDYGYFPHVTRSNCGMKNISQILSEIPGEHDITVNYVTRAYTTRHGAGPLDHEVKDLYHNIVDETNQTNDWQGSLRFAPLNYDTFESVTDKDFLNYAPRSAKKVTTVTCLDQLSHQVTIVERGNERFFSLEVFRDQIVPQLFDYQSFGPTRETIKEKLTP